MRQPNQFDVQGDGVTISYSTSSLAGEPLFNYQDSERTVNRSGDEIRTEETEIATLVTIDVEQIPEAREVTATLFLPRMVVQQGEYRNRARDHRRADDLRAPHRGPDADLPGAEPFRDGQLGRVLRTFRALIPD